MAAERRAGGAADSQGLRQAGRAVGDKTMAAGSDQQAAICSIFVKALRRWGLLCFVWITLRLVPQCFGPVQSLASAAGMHDGWWLPVMHHDALVDGQCRCCP